MRLEVSSETPCLLPLPDDDGGGDGGDEVLILLFRCCGCRGVPDLSALEALCSDILFLKHDSRILRQSSNPAWPFHERS